jgi:hypothetical protein
MKFENQVTCLELSKRLQELGVKQKSLFYWASFRNESSPKEQWPNVYNVIIYCEEKINYKERSYLKDKKFYSAFTVAELGEILRKFDIENDKHLEIDYYNTYDFYNIVVKPTKAIDFEAHYEKSSTEANARAKMLIYLLENDLIRL